eukprot:392446_1
MDFLSKEDDGFLQSVWDDIVMHYAINKSLHHNQPNIPLLLTRLHNKTKHSVFKETKHENDIHPFIAAHLYKMVNSFINHSSRKQSDLGDLQKIERNTISLLIRSYSSAPSPTSLSSSSSEQPRSLGQIIFDYKGRLEVAQ